MGCVLQEIFFRPTFHKWKGEVCRGFMIHITDVATYRPYFTSIALLTAVFENHKADFAWKPPPYEYEFTKMPIDLILGDLSLRRGIEAGLNLLEIKQGWHQGIQDFFAFRRPYLLYG